MLRGDKVGLRSRIEADVAILEAELYDDVVTRSRADTSPWVPRSPGLASSPFAVREPADDSACFSVVALDDHERLAGDALLWDNRSSIHRATAYDQVNHRRRMHRTSIAGDEAY